MPGLALALLAADRAVRADRLVQRRGAAAAGARGVDGVPPLPPRDRLDLGLGRRRLPLRLLELVLGQQLAGHLHLDGVFLSRSSRSSSSASSSGELDARGLAWRLGVLLALQLWISTEVAFDGDADARARRSRSRRGSCADARPRHRGVARPDRGGLRVAAVLAAPFVFYALRDFHGGRIVDVDVLGGTDLAQPRVPTARDRARRLVAHRDLVAVPRTTASAYLGLADAPHRRPVRRPARGARRARASCSSRWRRDSGRARQRRSSSTASSCSRCRGASRRTCRREERAAVPPRRLRDARGGGDRRALDGDDAAAASTRGRTSCRCSRSPRSSRPSGERRIRLPTLAPAARRVLHRQPLQDVPAEERDASRSSRSGTRSTRCSGRPRAASASGSPPSGLAPVPTTGKPLTAFDAEPFVNSRPTSAPPGRRSTGCSGSPRRTASTGWYRPSYGWPSASEMRRIGPSQLVGGVLVAPACGRPSLATRNLASYARSYRAEVGAAPSNISWCIAGNYFTLPQGLDRSARTGTRGGRSSSTARASRATSLPPATRSTASRPRTWASRRTRIRTTPADGPASPAEDDERDRGDAEREADARSARARAARRGARTRRGRPPARPCGRGCADDHEGDPEHAVAGADDLVRPARHVRDARARSGRGRRRPRARSGRSATRRGRCARSRAACAGLRLASRRARLKSGEKRR